MTIEPFEPAFLTEAARLYVRVFSDSPWNQRWTYEHARKRLSDICKVPGFYGLAHLSRDERLDGFVLGHTEQWCDVQHYFLKEMAVDSRWQREGIGSALMRELTGALPTLGVASCSLMTLDIAGSTSFFAKHGFAPNARTHLYDRQL